MNPPVTVIIPTYNGRHLLKNHLSSVEKILRADDQLLIIDDGSTDDSVSWLCKRYQAIVSPLTNAAKHDHPDFTLYSGTLTNESGQIVVQIVALAANIRFAKAVNLATQLVKSPFFLLLNNDVAPAADLLKKLLPAFADETVFAVGCHEYENQAQTIEGGKNVLWFERGIFQHSRAPEFTSGPTAWVSGGSGLFSREKWVTLGGFDLSYFPAYWEDTDLSFRARAHGWKILFRADAIVYHQHETSNQAEFGARQMRGLSWQHQRYFTRTHATIWQLIQYYLWQPYWWWKMSR